MTLQHLAWTAIALETLVFLAWLYKIWFPGSGEDAAGHGLGLAYTLGLGVYLLLGSSLLLIRADWAYVLATVLALLPVLVTIYGLIRWWKNRGTRRY